MNARLLYQIVLGLLALRTGYRLAVVLSDGRYGTRDGLVVTRERNPTAYWTHCALLAGATGVLIALMAGAQFAARLG